MLIDVTDAARAPAPHTTHRVNHGSYQQAHATVKNWLANEASTISQFVQSSSVNFEPKHVRALQDTQALLMLS